MGWLNSGQSALLMPKMLKLGELPGLEQSTACVLDAKKKQGSLMAARDLPVVPRDRKQRRW